MEIKDYCRYVDSELTIWKARLYDVISKMDSLPTDKKQRMFEEVNGLHIVVSDLENRIEKLRKECPLAWEPEQQAIQSRFSELYDKYKEATGVHFDYDFGG